MKDSDSVANILFGMQLTFHDGNMSETSKQQKWVQRIYISNQLTNAQYTSNIFF